MISAIKEKILSLVKSMLKEGMSLRKISFCIALGVALGIFPVLGMTTLLCTIAAFTLRLNLPAIQLVNFMVYPLQIILLAPFYGAGSWLFKQQGGYGVGTNLIELIQNDFWGSIASLWNVTLYAIFIWMVLCPILILILYALLKSVLRALDTFRGQAIPQ